MPVDVLAVIVTHNSAHVVLSLLDSLPAAFGDLSYAVVVVDNGSTDSTVELLRERADCQIVVAENRGYSAGINTGVASGPEAPAILVLNPDVRLHPLAATRLLTALRTPGVGIVAPQIRNADGSLHHSLRREPTPLRAMGLNRTGLAVFSEYIADPEIYRRATTVDWALGAVLLISRQCHLDVGGWDETYFLYSEETDLSLRARERGWVTRYEPTAVATHIGGESGQSDATHAMQIVNRVRLYRRRNGTFLSWVYFILTVLSETSWALRGHREARFAVTCLLAPGRRPAQLGCRDRLMPT